MVEFTTALFFSGICDILNGVSAIENAALLWSQVGYLVSLTFPAICICIFKLKGLNFLFTLSTYFPDIEPVLVIITGRSGKYILGVWIHLILQNWDTGLPLFQRNTEVWKSDIVICDKLGSNEFFLFIGFTVLCMIRLLMFLYWMLCWLIFDMYSDLVR